MLRLAQPDEELDDGSFGGVWSSEMVVTGNMNLGRSGNPITILMEDEVTGEQVEITGVKNAFVVVEDTRKYTSGWLAMVVGSVEKMGEVLGFLSHATSEALKKLTSKG